MVTSASRIKMVITVRMRLLLVAPSVCWRGAGVLAACSKLR